MRHTWDQVQWGIGDAVPEPSTEAEDTRSVPEWLYLRTSCGQITVIDIDEARCHVQGTQYYPWYWIGLLSGGQVIPVEAGEICTSRITLASAELVGRKDVSWR
jgi:hypothetical protein